VDNVLAMLAHLAIFALLIALARLGLNQWSSTKADDDSAAMTGNMAVAVRHGAFYLALGVALSPVFALPGGGDWRTGLLESSIWGAGILVALFVALFINDKLILPSVDNSLAVGQNNVSVALVEAGSLLGSAFIMVGTLHGTGPVIAAAVFFLIGQFAMVATVWLYRLLARSSNLQKEIESKGNFAAGILLTGKIVAVAIIIRNAVSGDSHGWAADLAGTLVSFVVGLAALTAVEFLFDLVFLPKVRVADLVREQRPAPIVMLAASSIAAALLVTAVSPF
jgi:uncharacterized membrane protein YjfL (UPF0719 family)